MPFTLGSQVLPSFTYSLVSGMAEVHLLLPPKHICYGMQAAFELLLAPILTAYAPDVLIVAAGFDAAEGDPLGGCKVIFWQHCHMLYVYVMAQTKDSMNGTVMVYHKSIGACFSLEQSCAELPAASFGGVHTVVVNKSMLTSS